jgi:hypothetical protein
MRRAVIASALTWMACGAPSAPNAPIDPGPPARPDVVGPKTLSVDVPVEQHAVEIEKLLQACDRDGVRAQAITYAEITEITSKEVEPNEISEALEKLMDAECEAAKKAPKSVVSARIVEQKHYALGDEKDLKKEVDVVQLAITFEENGKREERERPLVFFKTDRGWRFSPKK